MAQQFGKRVRALREARGLSQSALAAKAKFNVKFLSRLETSTGNVTLTTITRLADALGVPISELFADADKTRQDDRKVALEIARSIVKNADDDKARRFRVVVENFR